eukprot:CAMPEP_0182448826 /NCGR_PEP_ID=MMETSP1172-20130603/30089_1 /TAXON_ID=708627 /ORGANISM="Timspurckia oligopyrenoides, Strain CCMP3278" /LENGTH=149 /DNA_ID=CAMNT_0024645849 /DNA_START=337 /DNA_END=783 /DNA_ORIENTATION=+
MDEGNAELNLEANEGNSQESTESLRPKSCFRDFNKWWRCHSAKHQIRAYYMVGVLDDCALERRRIMLCTRSSLMKPERVEELYAELDREQKEKKKREERLRNEQELLQYTTALALLSSENAGSNLASASENKYPDQTPQLVQSVNGPVW